MAEPNIDTDNGLDARGPAALNHILPYAAWTMALLGVVGSLFFSEVMELPPCVLCWYQRIAMYPLVLIIGIGIATQDSGWKKYALPLALIGLAIAIYHNLLYYGVIPEAITPCSEGVPCNAVQIELLGFITIPLMGLAAFAAISLCLLFYKPNEK
jgi:disulfide bond formation protein DsbB